MPDDLNRLKTALADRYAIERELGSGGMATVYLAKDLKLERHVAVKVVRPELAAVLGKERFLREVKITARLEHPHILGLYDSGEADGFLYYVMPYVEGESLRDRLEREKQLPLDDALQIAREVADALSYAHSHDVIHRDIKPENILLESGHAVVADFGIARAISAAGGDRLTETGLAIGTPSYMSPEQAAGSKELDGRSDLYSLGCVLYEMLAGQPPFTGPTVESVIQQHLTVEAQSIANLRPAVPAEVAGVLARALAKTPADRFSPVAQFAEALRASAPPPVTPAALAPPRRWRRIGTVAVVGVVVVVAVAAALVFLLPKGERAVLSDRVVVAVFENQTGDGSLDPVGRMASDWITQGLAQTGIVDVVPTASALQATSQLQTGASGLQGAALAAALAEETDAMIAVSGTYFRDRDSLRFHAEVMNVSSRELLSAVEPVSGPLDAPLEAIELLRQRVIGALATIFDPRLQDYAAAASTPPNFDAYREFIEGLEYYVRGQYREAIPYFYRAASADSTFMLPLMQAAAAAGNLGEHAVSDSLSQIVERSRGRLSRYDSHYHDSHLASLRGDLAGVLEAWRGRAQMAPSSQRDLYGVGWAAVRANRPQEALEALRDLDPERGFLKGWIAYWVMLAHAHHVLGEYQEELEAARRAQQQYPNSRWPRQLGLRALAALGHTREIEGQVEDVLALSGSRPGWVLLQTAIELRAHAHADAAQWALERAIGWYEARPPSEMQSGGLRHRYGETLIHAGRFGDARGIFEELLRDSPENVNYLGYLGVLAAREGDREEANRVSAALAVVDQPYLLGAQSLWQARIMALLGEPARAVALLRDALGEGVEYVGTRLFSWETRMEGAWLHNDIALESLRDYPPFQELMRPKG